MQIASKLQLPQSGTPSSSTSLKKTLTANGKQYTFLVSYGPETNKVTLIYSVEVTYDNGTKTRVRPDEITTVLVNQLNWKAVYEMEQSNAEFERMMAAHEQETRYSMMNMYEAV